MLISVRSYPFLRYLLHESDGEGGDDGDGEGEQDPLPIMVNGLLVSAQRRAMRKVGRMAIEQVSRTRCTLVNGLPVFAQRRR